MFYIFFFMILIWISWKILLFGIKAAWGFAKIVCSVLFFPLLIISLLYFEFKSIAVMVLVTVLIFTIFMGFN
jgi:hypothetical protein